MSPAGKAALAKAVLAGEPIHAVDADGRQRKLGVVDHPAGSVTLLDGQERRTMKPAAAIELAVRLIMATRQHVPGAISGAF